MLIYLPTFILSIQNICNLLFIFTQMLRWGKCVSTTMNHTQNIFVESVHGYVGVAFRHELKMIDKFLDKTAENVKLDFIHNCGASTKLNWVNTSFKSKKREIYGFPLDGNKGIFSFCIQHSDRKPKKIIQKVNVNITELAEEYSHEIRICTTLNEKRLGGELVTRYQLVATLAKYLLNKDVFSVKIHNFKGSCIIFSFRFLQGCSHEIIKSIRTKLFDEGNTVSRELNMAVANITQLTHVNMTESPNCVLAYNVTQHERAKWMATVIPLLIFLFVIGLPVSIACYVCRGVRKRQNKMMQQRERALKEEEARLNELKRSNNIERNMIPNKRLSYTPPNKKRSQKQNQQHQHQQKSKIRKFFAGEEKKKMFVAKVFDDYVPHAIQERREYERTEMNNSRSITKHDQLFNPVYPPHTSKNENLLTNHIGGKTTHDGSKPLPRIPQPQTNYKNSPIFPKYSTTRAVSKQNYDDLSLTSQSTSQTVGSSHMSSMRKPNTAVVSRRERVPSDHQKGSYTFRNQLLTISEGTKNLKSVSFYDDDSHFPASHSAPQTRCASARGKNKQRASVYRQRSAPCIPVSNLHQNFDKLNPSQMNNPNNMKKLGASFENDVQKRHLLSNNETKNRNAGNIYTTDPNTSTQQPTKSTTDSTSSRRSLFDSVITIASTGKNLLSTSIKDISIKKTADIANKTFHDLLNRTQRNNSVPTSQTTSQMTSKTDTILNVSDIQPSSLSEFSYQKYSSGTTTSSRIYFSDDLSDDVFIQTSATHRSGGENEPFLEGPEQFYGPSYSFDRGPMFNPDTPLLNDNSFNFQGNPSSYPNSINNERQQFVPPNFGKSRVFKSSFDELRGGHHYSRRFRNDHDLHGYRKPPHGSTHRNKKDLIYPFKVDDNLSIPYLGSKKYFYKNRDKRSQTLDGRNRMGTHSYFNKTRYQSCSLEDISPGGLPTIESANIPNTDLLHRKFNPNSFQNNNTITQQQQQSFQQKISSVPLNDSNGMDTDISDVIGSSSSSIVLRSTAETNQQQFFQKYHQDSLSSNKENIKYNPPQHIPYTSAIQRGHSMPLPLPNQPQGVEFRSYSSHDPTMNVYLPYSLRNASLHQSQSLEETYSHQDNTTVRYSPESNRIHILPTSIQVDNNNTFPTTPIAKTFTENVDDDSNNNSNNEILSMHNSSIPLVNQQKSISSKNNSTTQQLNNFATTTAIKNDNNRTQQPTIDHRGRSLDRNYSEEICIGQASFEDNILSENQGTRADNSSVKQQQQTLLFDKHQDTLEKKQKSRETNGRMSSPVQIVPSFEKVVSNLNNDDIQKPILSNAARKRSLFRLHKENISGRIDSFEQQQDISQNKIPRFTHSNNSSFAVCRRHNESALPVQNPIRNMQQHQNVIANTNYLQPPHFFPDDTSDGNSHPDRKFAQSFESNSSVVTYMDLGSEYEIHPESTSQALSPNTGHDSGNATMNVTQDQKNSTSIQHMSSIISDTYQAPYETNPSAATVGVPSIIENQKLLSPPSDMFYQSNAGRNHETYSDSSRDEEEFV